MFLLLFRYILQHIQPTPNLRALVYAANINDSVVEMINHLLVWPFAQESLIRVHTITCQQPSIWLWDVELDIFQ